jgi:hypothetical protein
VFLVSAFAKAPAAVQQKTPPCVPAGLRGSRNRELSSVHSRAQSCRATVMVVVVVMRVMKTGDHESPSVLEICR